MAIRNFNRYGGRDRLKQNQREDIKLVNKCASKLGLQLKRFRTNDKLELYFDIFRDNDEKSICCISRGWDDPGYRVGECIRINKDILGFREKFYKILNICSDNLIAVKVSPLKNNNVGLYLQIGIYQDGFNDKVLCEALDSLIHSLQRIKRLL